MDEQAYIYLGQYHGISAISRLIRWRTWSEISHTAAYLPGCEEVIEAWSGGVRRRHWTEGHTPGTQIDLYRVPCTPVRQERFYSFLTSQLNKGYDYNAILGFLGRVQSQDAAKWFCSELVFTAADKAAIVLLQNIPAYKVDPGTLNLSPLLDLVEVRRVPEHGRP
jgi:uncharacterized protein YycO